MKRIIRSITRFGYQHIAKPILFLNKPDTVHNAMIRTAKLVQKTPVVRALPKLWSYQNEKVLGQTIAGLYFRNPVGVSAGFDKKIEMPPLLRSVGFGWMTAGSVTYGAYKGNEGDWYFRLPKTKSIVVNAGLPSEGTPVVAERVRSYDTALFDAFPLNVSVAKTNDQCSVGDAEGVKDYCESLKIFDGLEQVSMHEINISCPNTFGGEPFTTPARLEMLLAAVDALKLRKLVFVKMPISMPLNEYDKLLEVIVRHNVTGVTVGNLMKDRSKATLSDPLPDGVKGNLSGTPNKKLSTELVRRTYGKYGNKLVIIGVGGVMSAEDAYEKIRAGASLVALITGLIFEGPQVVGDINHGLTKLLQRDGLSNISDAIGLDA